ncbi:MAG: PASTA domain-containing protein [Treponema sp.]|nr:PASTA domain-containing protein [Treponema sp.]
MNKSQHTFVERIKQSALKIGNRLGTYRVDAQDATEHIQQNGAFIVFTVIGAFVLMAFVAAVVFFITIRGPEKVLVPHVVGKDLETALLELQSKELNARIQLRYSDSPNDAHTILEQSPKVGAIVKGYADVSLVVSRGVIIDAVGDYIGKKLDDVQIQLQTLFAGSTRPLVTIAVPEYKVNAAEPGTILEQEPPPGTPITEPVTVHVVVSQGTDIEMIAVPDVVGRTLDEVLAVMAGTRLEFDFTAHVVQDGERAGTVVSQQQFTESTLRAYSRVTIDFAFPEYADGETVYGIFTQRLSDYPYALLMQLTAYPPDGTSFPVVRFYHTGGSVSIPYAVPAGTMLELSVAGTVRHKMLAEDGAL